MVNNEISDFVDYEILDFFDKTSYVNHNNMDEYINNKPKLKKCFILGTTLNEVLRMQNYLGYLEVDDQNKWHITDKGRNKIKELSKRYDFNN